MDQSTKTSQTSGLEVAVEDILSKISQEREKEIISRRFGLYDRKETLEQIGDMLGVTRERVRQLEKAILVRLRLNVSDGHVPSATEMEKTLTSHLVEMGRVARIQDLTSHLLGILFTAFLCLSSVVLIKSLYLISKAAHIFLKLGITCISKRQSSNRNVSKWIR